MIGYPYTYGDTRIDDDFDSLFKGAAVSKLIITIMLAAIPASAIASENSSIPVLLAEAVKPKKATKAIGPISAFCCMGAGYCAHIAQTTYKEGDVKASTAAACGAISFCCAQRVAEAYQL